MKLYKNSNKEFFERILILRLNNFQISQEIKLYVLILMLVLFDNICYLKYKEIHTNFIIHTNTNIFMKYRFIIFNLLTNASFEAGHKISAHHFKYKIHMFQISIEVIFSISVK